MATSTIDPFVPESPWLLDPASLALRNGNWGENKVFESTLSRGHRTKQGQWPSTKLVHPGKEDTQ